MVLDHADERIHEVQYCLKAFLFVDLHYRYYRDDKDKDNPVSLKCCDKLLQEFLLCPWAQSPQPSSHAGLWRERAPLPAVTVTNLAWHQADLQYPPTLSTDWLEVIDLEQWEHLLNCMKPSKAPSYAAIQSLAQYPHLSASCRKYIHWNMKKNWKAFFLFQQYWGETACF